MAYNKSMTIQHCVNNAMLPMHEVHFSHEGSDCCIQGQVLFFSAKGGHWLDDNREHEFVAIYDTDHGALIALLNMTLITKILPWGL